MSDSEYYEDDEGNRMTPISCEECGNIIGFINESDDFNSPIWCDRCGNIELKEEETK